MKSYIIVASTIEVFFIESILDFEFFSYYVSSTFKTDLFIRD